MRRCEFIPICVFGRESFLSLLNRIWAQQLHGSIASSKSPVCNALHFLRVQVLLNVASIFEVSFYTLEWINWYQELICERKAILSTGHLIFFPYCVPEILWSLCFPSEYECNFFEQVFGFVRTIWEILSFWIDDLVTVTWCRY